MLEGLERTQAVGRQESARRNGPSGADVMRALLGRYAIEPLPGESRAEALARGAEITTRELKDLLRELA
jgi:hypothetical protein